MSRRARLGGAAVALMIAMFGAVVPAGPANASSQFVGVDGAEARCANHPTALACFYYRHWHEAYWGTGASDGTLQDNFYFSGSGYGSGARVRNSSRKLHCDYYVSSYCESFVFPGFGGNDDWMFWQQVGELHFTWNNNASVRIV